MTIYFALFKNNVHTNNYFQKIFLPRVGKLLIFKRKLIRVDSNKQKPIYYFIL